MIWLLMACGATVDSADTGGMPIPPAVEVQDVACPGAIMERTYGRVPIAVHLCAGNGCAPSQTWSYSPDALEVHECAGMVARVFWVEGD